MSGYMHFLELVDGFNPTLTKEQQSALRDLITKDLVDHMFSHSVNNDHMELPPSVRDMAGWLRDLSIQQQLQELHRHTITQDIAKQAAVTEQCIGGLGI